MRWGALVALLPTLVLAEDFTEDFKSGLDPRRWAISTWTAPRNGPTNQAVFSSRHVYIENGVLVLKLTQRLNGDGSVRSTGGEIKTVAHFGYGTYEFELQASSSPAGDAVSGSITGASLFLNRSQTEIDIEVEGLASRSELTQTSTWIDETKPSETFKVRAEGGPPHTRYHTFSFVWLPGKVTFYRDGALISTHTQVVPSMPAPFIFNHWGTNDQSWGGDATPNVDRFMRVKRFTFKPQPAQPLQEVVIPVTR